MNMRVVNRMMPWIAIGSAAILAVVVYFDQVGPVDGASPDRPDSALAKGAGGRDFEAPAPVQPADPPALVAPDQQVAIAKPADRPAFPLKRTKVRPARRAVPGPATPPALEEPPDVEPPELLVVTPSGPEFSLRPDLEVRVRSEPGVRVLASGRTLLEGPSGVFTGTLRLSPGANELRVTAEDKAGNRVARLVRVTYVDLDRVGHDRQRIERMVRQLEDIRAAAVQLDRRILGLLEKMEAVAGADELSRLSEELHRIRQTRREVSSELANALGQVDSLLAVAP